MPELVHGEAKHNPDFPGSIGHCHRLQVPSHRRKPPDPGGRGHVPRRQALAGIELGRVPLRLDSTLISLSQYYSDRMAAEKFIGHVAPSDNEVLETRRRKFKIIVPLFENVARAGSTQEAFYNLLRSPAHYAAMIDSTVTRAGIGISIDEEKSVLIAQHFAAAPYPRPKLESFISNLFEKMKEHLTDWNNVLDRNQ